LISFYFNVPRSINASGIFLFYFENETTGDLNFGILDLLQQQIFHIVRGFAICDISNSLRETFYEKI
jgi:hypothetical protein